MTKMPFSPEDLERIDEVLKFRDQLDRLCEPGNRFDLSKDASAHNFQESATQTELDTVADGVAQAFLQVASQKYWCDHDYHPEQIRELLLNSEAIALATFAQIKSMLTFCVRGERFCAGHFVASIRDGRIRAILNRLQAIRHLEG